MNTVSSNTKYVVKVQNFNVIGASLKSANESNDKANIKAGGGMMQTYALKVIGSVLEAIF